VPVSDDVGEVSIDITGDATSFQTTLLATKVIAQSVGSAISRSLSGAISNESRIVDKTFKGLKVTAQTLVRIFTVLAPVIGGAVNVAAAALTALAGSVYQTVVAGGALVGIVGALATAAATGFVAFRGMSDAIKGTEGALGKLAKPAQQVVKTLKGFKDEAEGLRKAVQGEFFKGLSDDVQRLGNIYLPIAKKQMVGMAGALNGVVAGIAKWAAQPKVAQGFSEAMKGNTAIVKSLGSAAVPVLQGLLDLYRALVPSAKTLTGSIGKTAEKFAEWAKKGRETGSIAEAMDKALASARILWSVLKNLGASLNNVLKAASGAGNGLLKSLDGILNKFRKWTGSVEGQNAIAEWAKMGADALKGVGGVIAALFPVMKELSKPEIFNAIVEVIKSMALTLATIMPYITPIIQGFASMLSAIAPILGPLLALAAVFQSFLFIGGIIMSVVKALHLVTIVTKLWSAAMFVLNAVLAGNPIALIIIAVAALVAAFIYLWRNVEGFRNFWIGVWNLIKAGVAAVVSWFQTTMVPIFQRVFAVIVNVVRVFWNAFRFYLAVLLAFWITVFNAIRAVVTRVWGWIGPYVTAAIKAVWNVIRTYVQLWLAVFNRVREIVGTVTSVMGRVLGVIGRVLGQIIGRITGFIADFTRPFRDLAGNMLETGRNIVEGIWKGISGAGAWLRDKVVAWVKDTLPGPIAKALGISSPSKVFAEIGKWVVLGLGQGVERNKGGLTKAANTLMAKMDSWKERLKNLKDEAKNYASQIAESFVSLGDVSRFTGKEDAPVTFGDIKTQLTENVKKAQEFQKVIEQLRKAGLNDTALKQLLAAGPDSLGNAQALLSGGKQGIKEINSLQAQLAKAGTATGNAASKDFYGAGIAAAEGMIKGLQKLKPEIVKVAQSLGKEVAAAVKKALGIKSPSKVMEDAGRNTVLGFVKGIDKNSDMAKAAMSGMSDQVVRVAPQRPAQMSGAAVPSTASSGDVIHIDVNLDVRDLAELNTVKEFIDRMKMERLRVRQVERSGKVVV
jgi:phage-related protein